MIRRTLIGLAMLSAISASAKAQVKVERGLKLDSDGAVRISNLVGSVHVTGWDRDSVALRGSLPKGARPDLSVDGTIQLEKLDNVLSIGRPAFGQEQSTVGMFVLEPGGKFAHRVPVKLGRGSVNAVEIVDGLHAGDQAILSDMSRWDGFNRVRLE